MPFSTSLIGVLIEYRAALLIYQTNILLLGIPLLLTLRCAQAKQLLNPDMPTAISAGVQRRIIIAQSLYAFGAAICVINIYSSLGFIILV